MYWILLVIQYVGMAALFFEILFSGYATPMKCLAFWRLALNS